MLATVEPRATPMSNVASARRAPGSVTSNSAQGAWS
jgi:hypothetical protein